MLLYIDPGTGSMLFYLAMGLASVLYFTLRGLWVKLKTRAGKRSVPVSKAVPFVIFSDGKQYWPVFEPVIKELSNRSFEVLYLTMSPDDPGLLAMFPYFKAEFIGTGAKAFARMNFLKASIVLSTTPGFDVYQWKRSKDVAWYVHLPHGVNDSTTGYRFFGLDWYDAVMVSGDYQVKAMRALEHIRNGKEKEAVMVGVPYLDALAQRARSLKEKKHDNLVVLVAPTWGPNSIFNRYGDDFIKRLVETGYHIILRPHPQSFASEKDLIEHLRLLFPDVEWNTDADNFSVLARSDVMISDYSGVMFDFAFAFDKPVICAETNVSTDFLDVWWLDELLWAVKVMPKIGPVMTKDDIPNVKSLIDKAVYDHSYVQGRAEAMDESWQCRGRGASLAADYLIGKYEELSGKKEEPESGQMGRDMEQTGV